MNTSRYFIELCYDGTDFHGWQTQPNASSVQACIDRALSVYFRQEVISLGCGRTDAGVHATQFYAHFDLVDIEVNKVLIAIKGLNALLPYSISLKRIFSVAPDAHARFDATERSYQYRIHFEKDPFKLNRSWLYKGKLNLSVMNNAAAMLKNYSDFTSFSKTHTQTFTNNCKIREAYFEEEKDGSLIFHISADRFLRNMVRAIVGTLVDVGKGEIEVEEMGNIIERKDRTVAGQSVPACGLYLVSVKYPNFN